MIQWNKIRLIHIIIFFPNFRKKRGCYTSIETEEQLPDQQEVKIKIPDELKPWLVNDWDAICRQHKLVNIPAMITVKDIIDAYVQTKKSSADQAAAIKLTTSINKYFNAILASELLYKSERAQHDAIRRSRQDVPVDNLYGPFHLLRLFVRMGSFFSFLDSSSLEELMNNLQDFLKYLVENRATLFNLQDFVSASNFRKNSAK